MLSLTDDVRQNPAMLAELSREYEALKASKAPVDFNAWIKSRLRVPPAVATAPHTPVLEQQLAYTVASAREPQPSLALELPGQGTEHFSTARPSFPQAGRVTKQPLWTSTASLQTALKASKAAVPHLQAAAERDRRMALTSALAKQEIALGVASNTQATAQQQVVQQRILDLAERLAAEQQDLLQAVQGSHAQLASQQAMIDAVLAKQQSGKLTAVTRAGGGEPKVVAEPQVEHAWFVKRHIHSKHEPPAEPDSTPDDAEGHRDQKQRQRRRQHRHQKQQVKAMLRQLLSAQTQPTSALPATQHASGSSNKLLNLLQGLRLAAQSNKGAGSGHGRPGVAEPLTVAGGDVSKAFDAHVEQQLASPHKLDQLLSSMQQLVGLLGHKLTQLEQPAHNSGAASQLPSHAAPDVSRPGAQGHQSQGLPASQAAIPPASVPAQPFQQQPAVALVELQLLLSQLRQLEKQEDSMRSKWLGTDGSGAGVAGQHDAAQREEARHVPAWQPPAASPPAEAQEFVSPDMVANILEGRRQFLHAQKLREGLLMSAADPSITPVDIVEDIADALLDELLLGQAQEMLDMLGTMGDKLFEAEFAQAR